MTFDLGRGEVTYDNLGVDRVADRAFRNVGSLALLEPRQDDLGDPNYLIAGEHLQNYILFIAGERPTFKVEFRFDDQDHQKQADRFIRSVVHTPGINTINDRIPLSHLIESSALDVNGKSFIVGVASTDESTKSMLRMWVENTKILKHDKSGITQSYFTMHYEGVRVDSEL